MAATGFGGVATLLEPLLDDPSLSSEPHAASGVATSAVRARAARPRLAVNVLVLEVVRICDTSLSRS